MLCESHCIAMNSSAKIQAGVKISNCRQKYTKVIVLCCPVLLSHFLHSLGNYTRRAIFSEMCKINQSSVDFDCKPFG